MMSPASNRPSSIAGMMSSKVTTSNFGLTPVPNVAAKYRFRAKNAEVCKPGTAITVSRKDSDASVDLATIIGP